MAFDFVNDPPGKPESRVPDYNPLGKIPVLLPNEGGCWFDSPLLAEYVELTYPEPAFYRPIRCIACKCDNWKPLPMG
ncbi:glutathione S-transferase N-terminal domain-containing protein [Plesiomonas shigelloides subsp. oncorhynchi]|nr:glutathione S-transferase N-terminal domain-containing protein [Plesiomonas shigelloides]